jgi:hypothetical protein
VIQRLAAVAVPFAILTPQDCSAADKAHAGYQTFDDSCHCFRACSCDRFSGLNEAAGRNGNEGKGAQTRTSLLLFAIPPDRECEGVGSDKRDQMGQDVEIFGPEKLLDHCAILAEPLVMTRFAMVRKMDISAVNPLPNVLA